MSEADPTGAHLRAASVGDVASMAALHASCIAEGFLVALGPRFLRLLYGRVVASSGSFAFVADGPTGAIGFVACTTDTRALYREFLRRDGVGAGAAAFPRAMRSPRRLWETWRYGGRGEHDASGAELLALAVAPEARGRGMGRALVTAAVDEFRRREVESARVVTATGNDAALRCYEAAGFRRVGTDEVHRGVRQEALMWP